MHVLTLVSANSALLNYMRRNYCTVLWAGIVTLVSERQRSKGVTIPGSIISNYIIINERFENKIVHALLRLHANTAKKPMTSMFLCSIQNKSSSPFLGLIILIS